MTKNVALLACACLLFTAGLAYGATASEDLNAKLDARVHGYDLAPNSFVEALTQVAGSYAIPMGISWVNTPAARIGLNLHWGEVSVREILETVVRTQPDYEMSVSNDAVHVYASTVAPDQNFLLIRVERFAAHHQILQSAERDLRRKVRAVLAPSKESPGGVGGSLAAKVGEPKVDVVELNDVTVQTILDALLVASDKKIWIVTFSDDTILTTTGFRRTLTLWNTLSVPDNEQPVWNMFSWSEPLPSAELGRK